jgi:hypothetical protein
VHIECRQQVLGRVVKTHSHGSEENRNAAFFVFIPRKGIEWDLEGAHEMRGGGIDDDALTGFVVGGANATKGVSELIHARWPICRRGISWLSLLRCRGVIPKAESARKFRQEAMA